MWFEKEQVGCEVMAQGRETCVVSGPATDPQLPGQDTKDILGHFASVETGS